MWDVVIDVAVGLWPSRDERIAEQSDADTITVQFGVPGAFTRGLDESGWLADEVIAAGALRQGKAPSLFRAVTGLVLIELARRRSKTLPREFVLAATADRVVAFAMSAEGAEGTTTVVKIKRGELGSWPRDLVWLIDLTKGLFTRGATLELAGVERIPVTADGDDSTNELIELLSR
jgi:hypothetical protein